MRSDRAKLVARIILPARMYGETSSMARPSATHFDQINIAEPPEGGFRLPGIPMDRWGRAQDISPLPLPKAFSTRAAGGRLLIHLPPRSATLVRLME